VVIYSIICFKRFVEAIRFLDKNMLPLLITVTLRVAAKFGGTRGHGWSFSRIYKSLCIFNKELVHGLTLYRLNYLERTLLETLEWKVCFENILNEEFNAWGNWLRSQSSGDDEVVPFSVLTLI
tara:strand:- start:104 stop:472 length:369 start_codon:yes stop_codon:yes gene_type:complete